MEIIPQCYSIKFLDYEKAQGRRGSGFDGIITIRAIDQDGESTIKNPN
jgi:hypothetical protein